MSDKPNRRNIIILGIVAIALCGPFILPMIKAAPAKPSASPSPSPRVQATATPEPTTAPDVMVHVAGAVQNPGLYVLPQDSRASHAIAAAGGFTAEAEASSINLAAKVYDGQQLLVLLEGEMPPKTTSDKKTLNPGQKINLNTATLEELMLLPNIGEVKAASIIQYREENGEFRTVEQLGNVSGIGAKTLENLKEYIAVE